MHNGIKFYSRGLRAGRNVAWLLLASGMFLSAQAIKAPCLKPAMGWNSYDCYNWAVTQAQFMANAHYPKFRSWMRRG